MYVSARKIWRISEEFAAVLLNFREEVLVIHVLMPIAVEVPGIFWKLQTLEVQYDSARNRDVTRSF